MKKYTRLFLLLLFAVFLSLPACSAPVLASPVNETALTAADQEISVVEDEEIPIQQAPSTRTEDPMMWVLKFSVIWFVVYMTIKLVRQYYENKRKI